MLTLVMGLDHILMHDNLLHHLHQQLLDLMLLLHHQQLLNNLLIHLLKSKCFDLCYQSDHEDSKHRMLFLILLRQLYQIHHYHHLIQYY